MVLTGDVFRLAKELLDSAPEREGVYALYHGNKLIYIGKADRGDTIRSRLLDHLSGENPCTKDATTYRYEVCDNPRNREECYLQMYRLSYKELPRCNVSSA